MTAMGRLSEGSPPAPCKILSLYSFIYHPCAPVCVCGGGLSFSQVLGGDPQTPRAWSQVAHPEQQQCPGHHSAE